MAKTEDVAKALEAAPRQKDLRSLIEASAKELGRALPEHLSPERLVRIALTCIRLNPKLSQCTPESFLGSLFTLAQLGLEPVAGRAYLLPFNNKRKTAEGWKTVKEVQALVGYKGLTELFFRHPKAVNLAWGVVHEKDDFGYELGTSAFLRHRPAIGNRGQVVGYWVMATLQGGGQPFAFMSREDCLEHGRRHSKTYDREKGDFYPDSPWVRDEQAMCLKTVLIQLSKLLPLSFELAQAIAADETSRILRPGVEPLDIVPEPFDPETSEASEATGEASK